jgi:hypothetical protein
MNVPSSPLHAAARSARRLAPTALLLLVLACPRGGGLTGTWEAADAEGRMTLEFKADRKVKVTMQETGGTPEAGEGDYIVDGNKVTVQLPGGFPLTLVHEDGTLQAGMLGQVLTFRKK